MEQVDLFFIVVILQISRSPIWLFEFFLKEKCLRTEDALGQVAASCRLLGIYPFVVSLLDFWPETITNC